jgi:hypothetical protein
MDDQLIREYKEAYRACNPGFPDPKVFYRQGFYYVAWGNEFPGPYRRATLIKMRDRLRATLEKEAERIKGGWAL